MKILYWLVFATCLISTFLAGLSAALSGKMEGGLFVSGDAYITRRFYSCRWWHCSNMNSVCCLTNSKSFRLSLCSLKRTLGIRLVPRLCIPRNTDFFILLGCSIWVLLSTMGQVVSRLIYIPESLDRHLGWSSMSLYLKIPSYLGSVRPNSCSESALIN